MGHVRGHNEDAFLERPRLGLWVVADGMGGHAGGAFASRLVVDRLGALAPPANPHELAKGVERTLLQCHEELRRDRQGGDVSGTTVAALLAFDRHFAVLWAGDSRCYRRQANGAFEQLSKDHSVVQDLVDRGVLTKEAARHHPLANRITSAVGAYPDLELEARQGRLGEGDTFLLCSDGLSGMVGDDAIETCLALASIEIAADRLQKQALDAGGTDNVTLVIVRFGDEGDDEQTVPLLEPKG